MEARRVVHAGMVLTPADLLAAESRATAATQGPWHRGRSKAETRSECVSYFADAYDKGEPGPIHLVCVPVAPDVDMNDEAIFPCFTGNGPTSEANAEFIATARGDAPAAYAALRKVAAMAVRELPSFNSYQCGVCRASWTGNYNHQGHADDCPLTSWSYADAHREK